MFDCSRISPLPTKNGDTFTRSLSLEYWGSQSGAYNVELTDDGWEFESDWSPVTFGVLELSKIYRDFTFALFYDEDINEIGGEVFCKNGSFVYRDEYSDYEYWVKWRTPETPTVETDAEEIWVKIKRIIDFGSQDDVRALAQAVWGGEWRSMDYGEYSQIVTCTPETEEALNMQYLQWTPNPIEGSFTWWELSRK